MFAEHVLLNVRRLLQFGITASSLFADIVAFEACL